MSKSKEEILMELISNYPYNEPTPLHLAIWDAAIEMAAEKAECDIYYGAATVDEQSILQLKFKK